jgi:hypothetical protein
MVLKSRRMERAGHIARMRGMRYAYKIMVRKPEGKRPLERPRRRWEDISRMYLWEVVWI